MLAELESMCPWQGGGSWDPTLPLRDLSTVAALKSAPLPLAGLPGYSNNHNSPPLGSLDSFKPSGWISRPSPSGSPVSLRRRPGVTSQSSSSGSSGGELGCGVGLRCGRWVVVRLLAGNRAAVNLPQRPYVPGQAGF